MKHLKRIPAMAIAVGLLATSFGAAAAQDATLPTDEIIYVTGEVTEGPSEWRGPDETKVRDVTGGFEFAEAITWGVGLDFSDPRLSGKLHIVQNGLQGEFEGGGVALIMPSTFHLVGDLCEWEGDGYALSADIFEGDEFVEEYIGIEPYRLFGQGDCAGLTAYLLTVFNGGEGMPVVEGLIFPDEIPALPVPASQYTP